MALTIQQQAIADALIANADKFVNEIRTPDSTDLTATQKALCAAIMQQVPDSEQIALAKEFMALIRDVGYSSSLNAAQIAMVGGIRTIGRQIETEIRGLSGVVPTVSVTATITSVTASTATSGGTVSSDEGLAVTARGVCWSTVPNPTITGNGTVDGNGVGSFTSSLTGLLASTTYYVRAYATNAAGTGYGPQVSFTTSAASVSTTLRDDVGHLLVSPSPSFNVDSIATTHPRFIDLVAFEAKITDTAYANYGGTMVSAIDKLIEAGNDGDQVANALLYHLDPVEDTTPAATRLSMAKTDFLSGVFTRRTAYWQHYTTTSEGLMILYAYDLLANEFTLEEKTDAWEIACGWGNRNNSTFTYIDRYGQGLNFWVPGSTLYFGPEYGSHWMGWMTLMAFAHDGVADSLISSQIDSVVAGTSTQVHSPWEVFNASRITSADIGGHAGGQYEGYGGSYFGLFASTAPFMFAAMKQCTGVDLTDYSMTTKQGRHYYYDNQYYYTDTQGYQTLTYATGQGSDANAKGIARWVLNQNSSTAGYINRLLLGDLRVAPLTPEEAGLSYRPGINAFRGFWVMTSGYNTQVANGDTRIRLSVKYHDVERIGPGSGAIAISRGTTTLTTGTDRSFTHRDAFNWSSQWLVNYASGKQGDRHSYDSGGGSRDGVGRGKRVATVLDDYRYYLEPNPIEASGVNWDAVTIDTTISKVVSDYGLSISKRCVVYLHDKDVVIVWDRIDASTDISQGIVWRHPEAVTVSANEWTIRGAKFKSLSPGMTAAWIGGVNYEQVYIEFPESWAGNNEEGYVQGYSIDPAKAERAGAGVVAVKPDSYNASNIYIMVCDVQSQWADATLDGDTITIDGVNVTINSSGTVTVN